MKSNGDAVQFFAKLMNAAGITPNNLPDNTTNTFQLFTAFTALSGLDIYTQASGSPDGKVINFTKDQNIQYGAVAPANVNFVLTKVGAIEGAEVIIHLQLASIGNIISFSKLGSERGEGFILTGTNSLMSVASSPMILKIKIVNVLGSSSGSDGTKYYIESYNSPNVF